MCHNVGADTGQTSLIQRRRKRKERKGERFQLLKIKSNLLCLRALGPLWVYICGVCAHACVCVCEHMCMCVCWSIPSLSICHVRVEYQGTGQLCIHTLSHSLCHGCLRHGPKGLSTVASSLCWFPAWVPWLFVTFLTYSRSFQVPVTLLNNLNVTASTSACQHCT